MDSLFRSPGPRRGAAREVSSAADGPWRGSTATCHGAGLQDALPAAGSRTKVSRCLARDVSATRPANRRRASREAMRARSRQRRTGYVQHPQSRDRMGRQAAHPGNRQDRASGRWRRHGHLRRDGRSRYGRLGQGAEARAGFLPAHRQLPGKDLRRRQDPGRLLQARGTPERKRDARFPADRPADTSAFPRRLQERHPGGHHRHAARSGEQSGCPVDGCRFRRADAFGHPLHGADRRRARRLHQWRIRSQSACRRDGRVRRST